MQIYLRKKNIGVIAFTSTFFMDFNMRKYTLAQTVKTLRGARKLIDSSTQENQEEWTIDMRGENVNIRV